MKSKLISTSLVTLGFLLGASALTALAWDAAPTGANTPPGCPTNIAGCNPPLNTALSTQSKLGSLRLNTDLVNPLTYGLEVFGKALFYGNVEIGTTTGNQTAKLKIVDGNQGAGKVLTSDANGLASWQTAAGGGGGTGDIISCSASGSVLSNPTGTITKTFVASDCTGGVLPDSTYKAALKSIVPDNTANAIQLTSVSAINAGETNGPGFSFSYNRVGSSMTTGVGTVIFIKLGSSGNSTSNWETGEISRPCQAYSWPTSETVTFSKTFTVAPKVFTQPKWERYTGNESAAWWVTNVTTTGFTMNYGTPNSGSCYPSSGGNGIMWAAVGQGDGDASRTIVAGVQNFSTPTASASTWNVPAGVTKILIEVWGANRTYQEYAKTFTKATTFSSCLVMVGDHSAGSVNDGTSYVSCGGTVLARARGASSPASVGDSVITRHPSNAPTGTDTDNGYVRITYQD